jgi:hypothetical protein
MTQADSVYSTPPTNTSAIPSEPSQKTLAARLAKQAEQRERALNRLRKLRTKAADEIERLLGFLDASDPYARQNSKSRLTTSHATTTSSMVLKTGRMKKATRRNGPLGALTGTIRLHGRRAIAATLNRIPPNPASVTMTAWASKWVRRTGNRGAWADEHAKPKSRLEQPRCWRRCGDNDVTGHGGHPTRSLQ